jgi:serine/threonine-protein kinase
MSEPPPEGLSWAKTRLEDPRRSSEPDTTTADPGESLREAESRAELSHAGRYRLETVIGAGGIGTVWRASDPDLGRPLAVKVMQAQHQHNEGAIARFLAEARLTAQLQHPGIPPVHEVGRMADGRPFFAMKLIEGSTLADLLAERPAAVEDLPRFVAIFEAICQTLAYVHSRGVIHRDLKPSNVMVGAFGEVQVMDWGLAKVLASSGEDPSHIALTFANAPGSSTPGAVAPGSPTPVAHAPGSPGAEREMQDWRVSLRFGEGSPPTLTQLGTVLGTPAYMAPEQARGLIERLDPRCDVFGLGAILCEVLTGQPPFVAAAGWVAHILAQQGELTAARKRLHATGADRELVALVERCLAVSPEDRPADAGAVAGEVRRYQEGVRERLRQAELAQATARVEARGERKRRRLAVGLAAALVCLVGLAAGAGLWYQHDRNQRAAQEAQRRMRVEKDIAREMTEVEKHKRRARELTDHPVQWAVALAEARAALARVQSLLEEEPDLAAIFAEEIARQTRDLEAEEKDCRLAQQAARTELEMLRLDARRRQIAFERAYPLLAALLAEHGLSPRSGPVPHVARLILERPAERRQVIVGVLDRCLVLAPAKSGSERAWLADVLERVDPDPWRGKVRRVIRDRLVGALDDLIREKNAASQPAGFLAGVAAALSPGSVLRQNLLRRALRVRPDDFRLNMALGDALSHPSIHWGHYRKPTPGERLLLAEALGYYRAARALRPDDPAVGMHLAFVLCVQGDLEGAGEAARAAMRAAPGFAPAIRRLAAVLREQGDVAGSLAASRKAAAVDPDLERKLSQVLAGRAEPASAEEALELARLCHGHPQRFTDAVRLYGRAFTVRPALAADPRQRARHEAACVAVLGAASKGGGADKLSETERVRLRKQALEWLRTDLAAWQELRRRGEVEAEELRKAAVRWQSDASLASVREREGLARLPEEERAAWAKWWADVAKIRGSPGT